MLNIRSPIMLWVPWLRFFLLWGFASLTVANPGKLKAVIRNPHQMVVEGDDSTNANYTILLDGSLSAHAATYEWSERARPDGADESEFADKSADITNVTIGRDIGTYKFRLRVRNGERQRSVAFSEVVVEDSGNVGMFMLAKSVVSRLMEMQYMYLSLSAYYQRADNYYENVAKYYRSLCSDRSSMLDEIMKYILAKQASVDLLNSCPPNYVETMMSEGLVERIDVSADVTDLMTSSFDTAIAAEKGLGENLAMISHLADNNYDYELSQFAAADLIPRVTKVINGHKNHLETVLRRVENEPHRHLAEFLFDKHLSV